MHRTTLTSAWALAALIVCLPPSAQAQDVRRDSVWNGVVAGAAIGGGLGLVIAKTTDSICSVPVCASLLAVTGGALGHLTDSVIGDRAPVVPGQWIDDSIGNGALIGVGVASAVLLIDLARHCGTRAGQVQCTAGGTVTKLSRAALFGAAVGAVVDDAIPKRAGRGAGRCRTRRAASRSRSARAFSAGPFERPRRRACAAKPGAREGSQEGSATQTLRVTAYIRHAYWSFASS